MSALAILTKCPLANSVGEMSIGEMSISELSVGEMSVDQPD